MSKELYQNIIKTLKTLMERNRIEDDEGKSLIGVAQWVEVREWLKYHNNGAVMRLTDALLLQDVDDLRALISQCQGEIEVQKQQERSQKLADWNNLSGTLSNWITFLLALWGTITGSIALLNDIFNWF